MPESVPSASLRRRLLAAVVGSVAAIWLATATASYLEARRELDALLDAHLAQAAALLVAQAAHELEEVEIEHAPRFHRYGHQVAFQIWDRGRVLLLHTPDAPNERLSAQLDGFSDVDVGGRPWRVFSTWAHQRRFLIQVGEERAARERVARAIGTNLLKPMILVLPLLAVLVWFGIRWATRPLATLGTEIEARDPDNLAHVEVHAVPAELAPLVDKLNRLLDRVRASIESERRFTADAAHELRTPIAAIRAHAEVARDASGPDERQTALDRILQGCDRAAHAVDQLLTLARLDPGDAAAKRERFDLRELAREVLAVVAPMAIAKGVEIELLPGPPVSMLGNRPLLAILIRNLVDNAVRYSPASGSARVEVVADRGVARLTVTDEGPGIAPEHRGRLGQRFQRLPGNAEVGVGLGLSIVNRIAELHRGVVRFADNPAGRGLSVVVTLPLPSSDGADAHT